MDFRMPIIPSTPQIPEIKSIPEYAFDALVAEIERFQTRLSNEMELGIVTGSAGLTIHVGEVRFSGQMVVFDGVDVDGRVARLIQHYTQVNVQMVAVPKLQEQPRRIGF